MTDYEIIEMMGWQGRYVVAHEKLFARIKGVVQKAVQTEREACAGICSAIRKENKSNGARLREARKCEEAIRARRGP